MQQQTIKSPITTSGIAIHTGEISTVLLKPAAIDTGIVFKVGDSTARATIENIIEACKHTTSIKVGDRSISCIEHLLSALFGLGVSNILIEIIRGSEIPVLDGSAKPWVDKMLSVGVQKQNAKLPIAKKISESIKFNAGISEYEIVPCDNFEIEVEIDFANTVIGKQKINYLHNTENYCNNIANARTFIADGANGQSLNRDRILNRLKGVDIESPDNCPCIIYERMRYITPLRLCDEPVAHKLLDFLGDFSFLNQPISCKIIAKKPSHESNILLVKELINKGVLA